MFFRTFSSTKPHSPTPGGNSQNNRLPSQTQKKHPSLRCSASMARYLRQFSSRYGQRNVRSIPPCLRLFGLDHLNKNPAWFLRRPKYRFSNIETCSKGPNYRFAKFFPAILLMREISKVPNQNSYLRILLARTTNKLQVFIHKKRYLLQTSPTMTPSIVKFIHKNIVY